jgi:hypothetical protein
MSFPAQAQVGRSVSGLVFAAWSAGHVERERAGFRFGPNGSLVRGALYARAGRGLFSYSGRISVVNSNISQFIFCSEIV